MTGRFWQKWEKGFCPVGLLRWLRGKDLGEGGGGLRWDHGGRLPKHVYIKYVHIFIALCFHYCLQKREGKGYIHICLSVCVSDRMITFEPFHLLTSFLALK